MEMDGVSGNQTSNNTFGEIEEIKEDEVEERFKNFKNFDIINPPFDDDHYFLDLSEPNTNKHAFLAQKIQQEWKTLETNLPDSIFVRTYENRIDLMRVALLGPPDTPYHYGLFFFDVFFPRNYPIRPPKLFYRSFGLNLNPDLRADGRVCLSLLDTWHERLLHGGSHGCNLAKWNPEQSNLLQVLVSIQTLVLNAQPYHSHLFDFNESEASKYNNKAFKLTCEAMILTLRNPPCHFEDFVAGHFRVRAHEILMKYRHCKDPSERLFHTLIKAFQHNGTYCDHHLGQLRTRPTTTEEEDFTEEGSPKAGIVTRVFGEFKNLLKLPI